MKLVSLIVSGGSLILFLFVFFGSQVKEDDTVKIELGGSAFDCNGVNWPIDPTSGSISSDIVAVEEISAVTVQLKDHKKVSLRSSVTIVTQIGGVCRKVSLTPQRRFKNFVDAANFVQAFCRRNDILIKDPCKSKLTKYINAPPLHDPFNSVAFSIELPNSIDLFVEVKPGELKDWFLVITFFDSEKYSD